MFFHNFHILTLSSYPFIFFLSSFGFVSNILVFFKFGFFNHFFVIFFFFVVYLWCKDINMEGMCGYHNLYVQSGFKFGLYWFVFSEFMFFFGIFWFFFDSVLMPFSDSDSWTYPFDFCLVNPFGVPFLNSCILLCSGATVTWCHSNILNNKESAFSLFLTCFLALYFIFIQGMEYSEANFNFSDSVFGSIFYMSTGFHGLHVLMGGLFLFFNLLRLLKNHFSSNHHLGLEFGIVYWHFVDVVWLFLFVFVYWWSY